MNDGGALGGQLEGVAVAAGDDCGAVTLLLGGYRSSEKIIGLEAGGLADDEAEGAAEVGQDIELVDELIVELAAALIAGQFQRAPIGHIERVPADDNGAGLLGLVKARQIIGESDNGATALATGAPDRLGQGVVGPVGEAVAVDDKQRARSSCHAPRPSAISRCGQGPRWISRRRPW